MATGFGGAKTTFNNAKTAKINIVTQNGTLPILFRCFPSPVGEMSSFNWNSIKNNWSHLKDISFPFLNAPVLGVLSKENVSLLRTIEDRFVSDNEPYAKKTILGWMASGRKNVENAENSFLHTKQFRTILDNVDVLDVEEVREQLLKVMDIERFPNDYETVATAKSPDELRAVDLFNKTLKFDDGKREVGLLWKENEPRLSNNFDYVYKRFLNYEKQYKDKPEIIKQFNDSIKENIELGYWEELEITIEEARKMKNVNFLAVFPVVRLDKTTTKVRAVMDAKAKFKGKSINDCLLQGPKNICDLVDSLSIFREKRVCVTGDVKHMFLQVKVPEKDRNFLLLLWRESPDQPMRIFRGTRHLFGLRSSPYVSIEVLHQAARDHLDIYPTAANAILKSSIVDDVLLTADDHIEALRLIQHLRNICSSIGMTIRKFASNSKEVLDKLPSELKASSITLSDKTLQGESDMPVIKVLGLLYLADKDIFTFRLDTIDRKDKYTKREMLSINHQIFDPLSFLAPFTITSRLLFQETWRLEKTLKWSDPLPDDINEKFKKWLNQLETVHQFTLPRCIIPAAMNELKSLQIHVFSDASLLAYCCVLFIRVEFIDGRINTNLLFSKARVCPVKMKPTVPRLELEAAKLGAIYGDHFSKLHNITDIHYWADNRSILWWINDELYPDKYVENRVTKILSLTKQVQWKYIETKSNPADYPTRGLSASNFLSKKIWFSGPSFLCTPQSSWPKQERTTRAHVPSDIVDSSLKRYNVHLTHSFASMKMSRIKLSTPTAKSGSQEWIFLTSDSDDEDILQSWWESVSKFRSYKSFLTVYYYVWFFIKQCRAKQGVSIAKKLIPFMKEKPLLPLRPKSFLRMKTYDYRLITPPNDIQLNDIGLWAIRREQKIFMRPWLDVLTSDLSDNEKAEYISESCIATLDPFVDGDGIIRMRSRLRHCGSSNLSSYPIIFRETGIPLLKARELHYATLKHYGSATYIMNEMDKLYHVFGLSRMCKKVIQTCHTCKYTNCKPYQPPMAPLPSTRVSLTRLNAFTRVGIDVAGEFFVLDQNNQKIKRYWLVFSCFVTRAVHIEVLWNKSADCTMNALKRFIARRGRPEYFFSDNATNFVKAKEILEYISKTTEYTSIVWDLNVPKASWFGGVYERMIGLFRSSLRRRLRQKKLLLKDEEFNTVVVETEAMLNNRPLYYKYRDAQQPVALTPADFLVGQSTRPGLLETCKKNISALDRFILLQKVLDEVWQEYLAAYLPTLRYRPVWHKTYNPVQLGDVVLCEEETDRTKWPLAIITKLYKHDKDSVIRNVQIYRNGAYYDRPIRKLRPIYQELQEE